MRKEGLVFFGLFVLVMLFGFVSASFDLDEEAIQENYVGGEIVRGKINISLDGVSPESLFSSNFEGNISVIDLLEMSGLELGDDFSCNTPNCKKSFVSGDKLGNLQISSGQERVVGFRIQGEDVFVESLNFEVGGGLGASCSRPTLVKAVGLEDDFLIQGSKHNGISCDNLEGCFDESQVIGDAEITASGYCEKIKLPAAPGYSLGARIKNSTTEEGELKMELFDKNWNDFGLEGECDLPKHKSNEEDLSCEVNVSSVLEDDFFVCVFNPSSQGDYKIRFEKSGETCGTDDIGADFDELDRDYEIFASSLEFSDGGISFDETALFDGDDLFDYVQDYLDETYDADCTDRCVVPFVLSGESQTLSINEIEIRYLDGNTEVTSDDLYEVEEKEAEINSGVVELDISKVGFEVENDADEFELFLDGERVLDKDIEVETTLDFEIVPRFALIGVDTEFHVVSDFDVKTTSWKFKGSEAELENDGSLIQKFTSDGDFEVEVEVNSKGGETTKRNFTIVVGEPRISANRIIEKYESRLRNVTLDIQGYPEFLKNGVESIVEKAELETEVSKKKSEINKTKSDGTLVSIITSLLSLDVPETVFTSRSGKLPIGVGFNAIDISFSEELSSNNAKDREEYKANLIGWINDNYNIEIEFDEISSIGDLGSKTVLTNFIVSISPIGGEVKEDGFFIIDFPIDKVEFKGIAGKKVGQGTYINLDRGSGTQRIEFYVEGPAGVSVADLRAYISPRDTRKFGESLRFGDAEKTPFPRLFFWLMILVLLVVFLIVYIILQEWYKKKYERYLFKNPDDLYNVITSIHNNRRAKYKDEQIRDNLKKKKWSGEQITYAFRKLDGKRTGMWEIPIFRHKEKKKVKNEIAKRSRQGIGKPSGPGGGRFIRKPDLRKNR